MKIKLNTILQLSGLVLTVGFMSSPVLIAKTWYDSEGRPLVWNGKRFVLKKMDEKNKSPQKNAVKKKPQESLLPETIKFRGQLDDVKEKQFIPHYSPYFRYDRIYPSLPYYRPDCNHFYSSGYYSRSSRNSNYFYLNYQKGDYLLRARF